MTDKFTVSSNCYDGNSPIFQKRCPHGLILGNCMPCLRDKVEALDNALELAAEAIAGDDW